MSNRRTYYVWRDMCSRCTNPKSRHFSRYGGRGIRVYERWNTFANFLADMGEAPPGLSIDRIDNNGNYELGNCRWATNAEQSRNTCMTRNITFNGETLCARAWEERLGLSVGGLWHRLKNGWNLERALTTPRRTA